jgi:arylsulfatase A-like enzyme
VPTLLEATGIKAPEIVNGIPQKPIEGVRDVLQLSRLLAGDVKESRNGNPTRDLQMAADRTRPHTLCGPVVSSLLSFAARC